MKDLKPYFENTRGTGVLATADNEGKVNGALYARPHFMEDGTITLIMNDRLSRANLLKNPFAAYIFIEEGPGRTGVRLYLEMQREEKNTALIDTLSRHGKPANGDGSMKNRYLVYFRILKVLPLTGSGEEGEPVTGR